MDARTIRPGRVGAVNDEADGLEQAAVLACSRQAIFAAEQPQVAHLHVNIPSAHPLPVRHWLRVSLGANNDIITTETRSLGFDTSHRYPRVDWRPPCPPLDPRHRKPPAIRICASALSSDDCPPSHESPAQTVGIQVRTLCLAFRAAVGQAVRSLLPSHSRRPVEPHDAAP